MSKSLSDKKIEWDRIVTNAYPEEDVKEFIKKLNIWWHSDDDQRSMEEFLKDEAGDELL